MKGVKGTCCERYGVCQVSVFQGLSVTVKNVIVYSTMVQCEHVVNMSMLLYTEYYIDSYPPSKGPCVAITCPVPGFLAGESRECSG